MEKKVVERYKSYEGAASFNVKYEEEWHKRVCTKREYSVIQKCFRLTGGGHDLILDLPSGAGRLFKAFQPFGKRFLEVRQSCVDIGAERLERKGLGERSARTHALVVPERILCFGEPSGDASGQPLRAGKRVLNLSQPLFDAGADGLKRCQGLDVRP